MTEFLCIFAHALRKKKVVTVPMVTVPMVTVPMVTVPMVTVPMVTVSTFLEGILTIIGVVPVLVGFTWCYSY